MTRRVEWAFALLVIAVVAMPCAAQTAFFPYGVYDKSTIPPDQADWDAYYAKVFALLADYDLNTIVIQPYRSPRHTLRLLDRAQQQGIRVVMSVGNPQNPAWDFAGAGQPFDRAYRHPAVLAYKYGDEPHDARDLAILSSQYGTLRRHYTPPIVTALVGETMDFSATDFGVSTWSTLDTSIRFARHYPIRRTYDLTYGYPEKMRLPYAQWARGMESSSSRPWWLVLQALGRGLERNEASYWRFPTAAEVNAMTHIALAYGARGVIAYALQDHRPVLGLVDDLLQPRKARDGSVPLSQLRSLAALIRAHQAFLARHVAANFLVATDRAEVLAVPRTDPEAHANFVYVVNQNAEQPVAAHLHVSAVPATCSAVDRYSSNARIAGRQTGATVIFPIELDAGGARLLQLIDGDCSR